MADVPERTPAAARPDVPAGYRIAKTLDGEPSEWSRAEERIAASRHYWISTTRPDGRPHAMPARGMWVDGALLFGTDRKSRKGRNIAAKPAVVARLESGDVVVALEGVAEDVTDAALLARHADAYAAKYQFRPSTDDAPTVTYMLRPRAAFTWLARDFPSSVLRWRWG